MKIKLIRMNEIVEMWMIEMFVEPENLLNIIELDWSQIKQE